MHSVLSWRHELMTRIVDQGLMQNQFSSDKFLQDFCIINKGQQVPETRKRAKFHCKSYTIWVCANTFPLSSPSRFFILYLEAVVVVLEHPKHHPVIWAWRMRVHARRDRQTNVDVVRQTDSQQDTHTHTHNNTHIHTDTCTQKRTDTNDAQRHTQVHTHIQLHTDTHARSQAHIHTDRQMGRQSERQIDRYTHTHTHTNTHKHRHTQNKQTNNKTNKKPHSHK